MISQPNTYVPTPQHPQLYQQTQLHYQQVQPQGQFVNPNFLKQQPIFNANHNVIQYINPSYPPVHTIQTQQVQPQQLQPQVVQSVSKTPNPISNIANTGYNIQ